MRRPKAANTLFLLCFLCFLFFGGLWTALRPKESFSYFENRRLTAQPELSADTFWDGSWFSAWDRYLSDHAALRTTLLKIGTALDMEVLRRPVINDVVVSGGMLLGYNAYETVDREKIAGQSARMADTMKALAEHTENCGGLFLYVAVPGQYAYFPDAYPPYLNNRTPYVEAALSAFTADMEGRGVELLDMGGVFEDLGSPAGLYSPTDYHYTFEGAYETYRAIMARLETRGFDVPLLTEDDIAIEALPNPYLGSRGRKLFNLPATGEKTAVGRLAREVPFTRRDNGAETPPQVYALPPNDWEPVGYTVYMGGDVAETVIDTGRPELPDILIVGDSFTNPVECLIYTGFNEMRSLDLRHYREETLATYIERHRPDIVVMLRDYEVALSTDGNGSVF